MENAKRVYKEIDFTDCSGFKSKIGTTNKNTTSVVFIQSRAKINIPENKNGFFESLKTVEASFKKCVEKKITENGGFKPKHLFEIDYCKHKSKKIKTMYIKYNLYLLLLKQNSFNKLEGDVKTFTETLNVELKKNLENENIEMLKNT